MADRNSLISRNLNMLRLSPEDLALLKLAEDENNASLFERRAQMQLLAGDTNRPTVRPTFNVAGTSGGYNMPMPDQPTMPYLPSSVNARFGLETDVGRGQLRGGVTTGVMQAQNDRPRFIPAMVDIGYATPLAGGQLDVSAMSPIERATLNNLILNARFSRRF